MGPDLVYEGRIRGGGHIPSKRRHHAKRSQGRKARNSKGYLSKVNKNSKVEDTHQYSPGARQRERDEGVEGNGHHF